MKALILVLWISIISSAASAAEIRGRVTGEANEEPLAFVAVQEEGTSNGVYTDIDGYFLIKTISVQPRLVFTYLGFETRIVAWDGSGLMKVQLTPVAYRIQEITVSAGENPADIIMRRVVNNRDQNNPEKNLAFTYDSYNKLIVAGHVDSLRTGSKMMLNSLDTSGVDSTTIDMRNFFSRQHLFMMESASRRSHLPPARDAEVVLASRVSGFSNATFTLLATELQSFSVYGDEISVLDIRYLSPLANSATSKYFFDLADTTFIGNDTVYTIAFRPRKGRNFKGLTGSLHINSDGWAVQHILASPADSADGALGIRIQQQYGKTAGVWFPEQLNTFLFFHNININGLAVAGVSHSYIRNLDLNPELRKGDFGPVVLRMEPKANKVPDSVWVRYREHDLDIKEQTTFRVLDSIGKAENFDRTLRIAEMLATGKIPFGIVSLDLNRLMRFNNFEGFRLGAGLHTNDFLSPYFSFGGYYAYGFKDRGHKFGGDFLVWLKRSRNLFVQALYEDDVVETGGRQLDPSVQGLLNNNFYPILINRMDRVRKAEVLLQGRTIGNLTAGLFVNRQEISPFRDFGLLLPRTAEASLVIRDFIAEQAGIQLRWAPGERLAAMGNREVRLRAKWPVMHARYTAGRIDELDPNQVFSRYDLMIDKTFRHPLFGDLSIRAAGGLLPDVVPGSLYYNARGANTINRERRRYIGIASPYNFETMRVNEFLHSRFAAVHVRYSLRDLLFHIEKWRPMFTLVHNMLWGELEEGASFNWSTQQATQGYFESGLVIDRLLSSGFSGFGVGVFYRYGEYALPDESDNIVVKLSASFVF